MAYSPSNGHPDVPTICHPNGTLTSGIISMVHNDSRLIHSAAETLLQPALKRTNSDAHSGGRSQIQQCQEENPKRNQRVVLEGDAIQVLAESWPLLMRFHGVA